MLGIGSKLIGRKVIYLREVGSTNDYARSIAAREDEGTVVVADVQTRGRGRKGRSWVSSRGGLWMSVILKPRIPPSEVPKLVFVGALAVTDALKAWGVEGRIKWPNDVLVNGKKVCGILSEASFLEEVNHVVLGMGINVNNPAPEEGISLKDVLGREVPLPEFFRTLVEALDLWYSVFLKDRARVLEEWRSRAILGTRVRVLGDEPFEGVALDVDDDGCLLVDVGGRVTRILYGDVSIRFN
ncbi:biotin--[acetyl-CoA-carboxylase] ligase [Palaeococcus ferrophilus]|uniref:biotin--[acetyl-CoA-carboxylase] ligase n=1 Tax=Palaeococcus ferrophilus TaxID=83868 RepID=UPI00064F0188|nr:biotin--[acetyl-CoA-carboxylase] ligase [Palaeococcus ferrophilus]